MLHHKRTLILIQRLAFFLCPKSLAPQGFFHLSGCMERAFPLFFGCKRLLMLVSPYSEGKVGCMIKRLLVVEPVAVLYWVHPFSLPLSAFSHPTCSCIRIEKRNLKLCFHRMCGILVLFSIINFGGVLVAICYITVFSLEPQAVYHLNSFCRIHFLFSRFRCCNRNRCIN